jgi:protein transport protein SEC24
VIFPPQLTASSEHIERHGIYLLENGMDMFIWVGKSVTPEMCLLFFGESSYESLRAGKVFFNVFTCIDDFACVDNG